jgi:hypothetical protein
MAEMDTTTKNGAQRTMIAPVETILPKSRFWSKYMVTGSPDMLPTKYVEWDYLTKGNPKAHFVGEGLTVPATGRGRFKTARIETPLYQHRKVIGLEDLAERQPGEPYGAMPQNMFVTAQERAGRLEAEDDIECIEAVAELREVITAKFLFEGIVKVIGYGVNRLIDYSLPNKVRLLGGDRWGQVGVSFQKDLREWCGKLEDLGFNPLEIIMTREVWDLIEDDEKWLKQLDNRRTEKGQFAPEKAAEYGNAQYQGTLRDPFVDLFVQRSKYYDDETETMQPHMPANSLIIVTAESRRNNYAYGSIDYMENGQFKTVSGEFVKEVWHDDRAKTREVIVTSRAVPKPGNLNSWFVATVM